MDFISQAVKLFGKRYDSQEITTLLAQMPPHRADKPSDGAQYILSQEGGFDLLFEDRDAIAGRRQNRTLCAIFLYAEGADKHKQFSGDLPFGFTFSDKRPELIAKKEPNCSWVIGKGRVPRNYPNPDSDKWAASDFNISVSYEDDGTIHHFQVTLPKELSEEGEWKAPPTWQDLAMEPTSKTEAILLYKQEHNVSTLDAKKAIEDYIAKNV